MLVTTLAKDYRIEWPAELKEHSSFRYGLVVPFYNRPQMTEGTLQSLSASRLQDTVLVLVDDASDNTHTLKMIADYYRADVPIIKIYRLHRREYSSRIHDSLRIAWDVLSSHLNCRYLSVLDGDTEVRPYWLEALDRIVQTVEPKYNTFFLTGFNAIDHSVIELSSNYVIKRSIGGCHIIFPVTAYKKVVLPALQNIYWDINLLLICANLSIPVLASKPSVVQHKGYFGMWSRGFFRHDLALDYYAPFLNHNLIFNRVIIFIYKVLRKLLGFRPF